MAVPTLPGYTEGYRVRRVLVEFDGVVHDAPATDDFGIWEDDGPEKWDPRPRGDVNEVGKRLVQEWLAEGWEVVLLSDRFQWPEGEAATRNWLLHAGLPTNLRLASTFLPHDLYVSTRCMKPN